MNAERLMKIMNNEDYIRAYHETEQWEETREFCKHDMAHFLDVARLASIMNLKENLHLEEDVVYATALLHDIGRAKQYEDQTPHEAASAAIAKDILRQCDFTPEEIQEILKAIASHRNAEEANTNPLARIIYCADKMSRPCFCCKSEAKCNWKNDKKNRILKG